MYDAENHQVGYYSSGNGGAEPDAVYRYDGDGKRVKKVVPATGEATIFVYNASGQLVAEYSTVVESQATAKVSYLTMDHLGSPRVVTDAGGAVVGRKDFSAYGEEILTPERVQSLGYQPVGVWQDYTGYLKDEESGLEFAEARYYNPLHGRFTSVDPLTASATVRNPQTFNRYAYALNSLYKFTDPLGLIPSSTGACGQWCQNNLGMSGEPMSVDGTAFRGQDTSFSWAWEWFGIVVEYSLNLPDGSVYEENLITGTSRRIGRPQDAAFGHQSSSPEELNSAAVAGSSSPAQVIPSCEGNCLSEMVEDSNGVGNANPAADRMGWPAFGDGHDGVHVRTLKNGANVIVIRAAVGHIIYWNVQESSETGADGTYYTVHIRTVTGYVFILKDLTGLSSITRRLAMKTKASSGRDAEPTRQAIKVREGDVIGTVGSAVGLHIAITPIGRYSAAHRGIQGLGPRGILRNFIDPCGQSSPVTCR